MRRITGNFDHKQQNQITQAIRSKIDADIEIIYDSNDDFHIEFLTPLGKAEIKWLDKFENENGLNTQRNSIKGLAMTDNKIKTTKELIYSAMEKYNKAEVSFVDKVDVSTMGFMGSGENMVKIDLLDGKLLVEADITKDNIADYYEFMSDGDKTKHHSDFMYCLGDRHEKICADLRLKDEDVEKIYTATSSYTGMSWFEIKDTLKPIDDYIEEIKESPEYKKYINNAIEKEDLVGDYILDKDVPMDAGTSSDVKL
ncbi:MAG: hypothetical protein RBR02_09330 [Desulfuromonadaceae bacterium]|nr:hypothetical protein [Desulfuromonadaceae bacterium]